MGGARQFFADGMNKLDRDLLRYKLHVDIGDGPMQWFSYYPSVSWGSS